MTRQHGGNPGNKSDSILEDEFGHLSPDEIQKLDADTQHKLRIISLQIASLHLLQDYSKDELDKWTLCLQHIAGDYSYTNI